jgi:hypothetical protein
MLQKRKSRLLCLGTWALALACNSSSPSKGRDPTSESEPDGRAPSPGADASPVVAPVPAPGPCECTSDAQCVADADARVKALREPATWEARFVGAECVARSEQDSRRCCYARPAVCLCYYAFDGSNVRDYGNAQVLGNRTTCDVTGRSPGCVYRSCEFPGCDPADSSSCDGPCADVDARLLADRARTFDAERRTARCDARSCRCLTVYRVGTHCYTHPDAFARPYDCSLGDEAILAAEQARLSAPPGPAMPKPPDPGPGCNP